MSEQLPILYTVEHASHDFGVFAKRTALSDEQQRRFSDYGTLDTVPLHTKFIAGQFSRGLIDLNRAPNKFDLFRKYDFGRPVPNMIWKNGLAPNADERLQIFDGFYKDYHDSILAELKKLDKPGIVVSWHNTAHYEIGKDEMGRTQLMRPFILSNLGREGAGTAISSKKSDTTTCDPEFLESLAMNFSSELKLSGLPSEVLLNFVYKGGYTIEHYNSRRHPELDITQPVQSIQLEYDTLITHDQKTLAPKKENMAKLRTAFEKAIEETYLKSV